MKILKLLLGTLALGCIPLAAQGQTVQGVKGAAVWFNITKWLENRHQSWLHFAVTNPALSCLQAP